MLFDWSQVPSHHLGFAAVAALSIALIVLLLPRDRRGVFLAKLLRGWLAGCAAGVIIAALMFVPVVSYYLGLVMNQVLSYAWKLGIRQPPPATILIVSNLLGMLIGLSRGIAAVAPKRQESLPPESESNQPRGSLR